ncbi:hypothetical protein PG988_007449 [Apiospora saccharicola]
MRSAVLHGQRTTGTFGRVYKATNKNDGELVAVKIINVDESDTVNSAAFGTARLGAASYFGGGMVPSIDAYATGFPSTADYQTMQGIS